MSASLAGKRRFVPKERERHPEAVARARFRRIFFITLIVLALGGAAAWYVAPRISTRIKAWHARRYAQEALALIENERWREASAKANEAYQLSPNEPEALRAIARLLTRRGEHRRALEWWARLDATRTISLADRRDYTAAALAAEELSVAANQINILLDAGGPLAPPIDLLLAAQLNARRMILDRALAQTELVLKDPRTTNREIFSVALLILSITAPESQPYSQAWKQIEALAKQTADPISLDALSILARQGPPVDPAPAEPRNFSDLNAPAKTSSREIGDEEVAALLESHPKAQLSHKLLALELRMRYAPVRAPELIAALVAQFSGGADDSVMTVANWLNATGHPDGVLKLLALDQVTQQRQFVPPYLQALAATQQWSELKQLLDDRRLPIEPFAEHVYRALARTHLGETVAGTHEWQRAIESATAAESLFWIASRAEPERAYDAADAAYQRAISIDPKFRLAYAGRHRLARAQGRTSDARAIAGEIVRLWPYDRQARLEALYLQLLLGPSPEEIAEAVREAEDGLRQNPADWDARKTLALARLKSGANALALELFAKVRVTGNEPPGALAVRAAVLAANGWLDGARNDAFNLGAAELLPEERALIAALSANAETLKR